MHPSARPARSRMPPNTLACAARHGISHGMGSRVAAVVASAALACACRSSAAPQPDPNTTPPPTEFGGDRPATLAVPDGYDPGHAYPLLVMLHGYRASGVA